MKRRWWIIGGVVALLVINISFFTWPTELLQLPLTVHDQPQTADVIIVLGAGARKHGQPMPPQAKERVQRGTDLLTQGYAPAMIVSGGLSKQSGYIESDLMKAYAISQGIEADAVIEENASTSTRENAVFSQTIMERNDWDTALVVTSPYHTYRACAVFRRLNVSIKCIAAPLTTIPTTSIYERLTDFRSVVREYGAILLYRFQGHI